MTLTIVTGVCGALEITRQWFEETIANTVTNPQIIVVANGCTNDELEELASLQVTTNYQSIIYKLSEPVGSTRAFNAALEWVKGDVVAMLHNDLMVREHGWDKRVLDWFEYGPQPTGVVGFHGSRALAAPDLYDVPYVLQKLARGDSWSNLEDAESHGQRTEQPMHVATLDGMALIARHADLVAWGGLDERYIHHMYDHDLCLTAMQHGRWNFLLPVRARHISGQTANFSRYNDRFAEKGGDGGVHAESHYAFYLKWKDTGLLPARV